MERVVFEKYNGSDSSVVLVELPEGKGATVIGAKAFLNCRTIHKLVLPETVAEVEDWGFAHMKALEELVLPAQEIRFGKKVFLGCDKLKRLIPAAEEIYEGIPFFLASSVAICEERLLQFDRAGDVAREWEWLKDYDEALAADLIRPEDFGYEPVFVGWFDVEDVDDQKLRFIRDRKKAMIRRLFQRFQFDRGLEEVYAGKFRDYLLGKAAPEIPQILEELFADDTDTFGDSVANMKTWNRLGGFEVLSARELLDKMVHADPEVRAYLMECVAADGAGGDFFGGLEL